MSSDHRDASGPPDEGALADAYQDALAAADMPANDDPEASVVRKAHQDVALRDALGLGISRLLHMLLSLFSAAHRHLHRNEH